MSWSRTYWVALATALVGCVQPATGLDEGEAGGPVDDDDGYVGQQGRLLLGLRDPDVRVFSILGTTTTKVLDDGEVRTDSLGGEQLKGALINAVGNGTTIEMRIAFVLPPKEPATKWQYALEQRDPATGEWSPACVEPTLIIPPEKPPAEPPLAIAMPGVWDRDGLYRVAPGMVTFACRTGVAAKCDGWGYPISMVPPTHTEHGLAVTVSGADMMQACTRMARADYCAEGVSNTLDGTPLHRDDIFQQPPGVNGYAFEAAWPGVAVVGRVVSRPAAICLSKLRWSTLPLGGTCPLTLPDPRVDVKGTFCEDMTEELMEKKGARVYSASTFLDAGLYSYLDPSTGTRLVTASLQPGPVGKLPEWTFSPKPPIDFPAPGQPAKLEATIFAASLPAGVPTDQLIGLSSYLCPGGDLVTTTSTRLDPGCTAIATEGRVYRPEVAGRAPLRRWYSDALGRSYTTATAPTTMIAQGWKLTEVIGGAIRASIDVNLRWSAVTGATYTLAVQTRTGEWISPCLSASILGTATSVVYRGRCTSAGNRTVDHADLAALRITAVAGSTRTGTIAYDGVASDAHIDIPGGKATAVEVTWNDPGPGYTYALDVASVNNQLIRCVDHDLLANGVSHVHTGSCPSAGTSLPLTATKSFRVCARTIDGKKDVGCGEVAYDGQSSRVTVDLPRF